MTSVLPTVKRFLVKDVDDFTIGTFMLIFVLCFVLVNKVRVRGCVCRLLPFDSAGGGGMLGRVGVVIEDGTVNVPLLTIVRKKVTALNCCLFSMPDTLLFNFLAYFTAIVPVMKATLM